MTITQQQKEEVVSLINEILENDFDNFFEENYEIDATRVPYSVYTGATKLVLYPNRADQDWVIKLPFRGGEVGCVFTGIDEAHYIEREETIYSAAKKEGLEKLFVENIYIGESDGGVPIYVQEKCELAGYRYLDSPQHKKALASCTIKSKCNYDEDICAIIVDSYGEEFFEEVEDLMDRYSVSDLHQDNIAFKDGVAVFIDYAGFWD